MTIEIVEARVRTDASWRLIGEFSQWYGRLGVMGEIPKAFAGITSNDQQVIVILSGLPLDDVERREFLIWLCREERILAYVYGTHVMSARSGETPTEQLTLYASSRRFNVFAWFAPKRDQDGRIGYTAEDFHIANAGDSSQTLFHELQSREEAISHEAQQRFVRIWQQLRGRCMWRDLRGTAH